MNRLAPRTLVVLFGLVIAAGVLSLWLGPVSATHEIILQLRLPRVILGFLVGMALATAGTIYQGLLRNPLADPYILGTSSGAYLGIIVAGILHFHQPTLLYSCALVGSIGAIIAVDRIARTRGKTPVQTLILAGVVVSTFLNSIVFLCFSLFFRESLSTLYFLMGSLSYYDPPLLKISALLILTGLAAAWAMSRSLNILALGDEPAQHLGIAPEKTKRILFFIASILVAAAVSVSGTIGFIGLIVPHCLRLLYGPDHRVLIPASALGGAFLLIVLDTAARTLAAPHEIPVGIMAALCGGPFFIYLLRKKKGEVF